MGHKYFQSGPAGNDIGDVQCVSMANTGGVESTTIVVNSCSTENNFLLSIIIYVSDAEAVRSLTAVGLILAAIRCKRPTFCQLSVAPVQSRDLSFFVVAARENHAGSLSIQVSYTGQKAVYSVAVVIAPIRDSTAWIRVINGLHDIPRKAIEYCQKFRPTQHITLAAITGSRITEIGICIANHRPRRITRTVGGFCHYFCLTISIKVVHHKLSVVRASADIAAE